MTDKTNRTYLAYLDLSAAEKRDLEEAIRKYKQLEETEKLSEKRSIGKIVLGPLGGTCPYCGK